MKSFRPVIRAVLSAGMILGLGGCLVPVALPPMSASTPLDAAAAQEAAAAVTASPTAPFPAAELAMNQTRATYGLTPAVHDPLLSIAAQRHADDMAANGLRGHIGSDGSTQLARVRATGAGACGAAENVAWDWSSTDRAMREWLLSPPHLAHILRRGQVTYGLAQSGRMYALVIARPC